MRQVSTIDINELGQVTIAAKGYALLGESEWDTKCAEYFFTTPHDTFLTNDYFNGQGPRKKLQRMATIFSAFRFALKNLWLGRPIIVTDLNIEGFFVSWFLGYFEGVYLLFPNTVFPKAPGFNNRRRDWLALAYIRRNRFFCVDAITRSFFNEYANAKIPRFEQEYTLGEFDDLRRNGSDVFVIAMPAVYSHAATSHFANEVFDFLLTLYDDLEACGVDVFLKPHPRDVALGVDKNLAGRTVITGQLNDHHFEEKKLVLLGYFSSLCLNHSLPGAIGLWIGENEKCWEKYTTMPPPDEKYLILKDQFLKFLNGSRRLET